VNRTGITPDINALTTIMVIVMIFGMIVMSVLQKLHKKKEARIMAESDARIQAARLAAEEY
jgi:spermidine/putrescine transport system permease protein